MTAMKRVALGLFFLLSIGSAFAQDVAPGRVALRPDEVDKAASKRLGRVKSCYKAALERSDRSYGTIGVGFRVGKELRGFGRGGGRVQARERRNSL